jgi:hypothetical protein
VGIAKKVPDATIIRLRGHLFVGCLPHTHSLFWVAIYSISSLYLCLDKFPPANINSITQIQGCNTYSYKNKIVSPDVAKQRTITYLARQNQLTVLFGAYSNDGIRKARLAA